MNKSKKIFTTILVLAAIQLFCINIIYAEKQPLQTSIAKTNSAENAEIKNSSSNPDNLSAPKNKTSDTQESLLKKKVKGQSIFQTIKHGGPLMIFLFLIGLAALTIIVERIYFYTRHKVWKNEQVTSLLILTANKSKASFKEELENELRYVFQVYANKLERGLSLLSGLGNLAPVVGFLGTVIGMIGAFSDIMLAASVNAKVVAGGIKVALVTTAGGLVVAAPALASFYFFMHIIQNKTARAEEIIGELSGSKQSFLNTNSEEKDYV